MIYTFLLAKSTRISLELIKKEDLWVIIYCKVIEL